MSQFCAAYHVSIFVNKKGITYELLFNEEFIKRAK